MKIISLNVRGLGGSNKRRYLKELIFKEHVGMVCIQETKCSEFGEENCFNMWGSNEIDWIENGAINNAGGIITLWRRSCFQLSSSVNGSNFSIIEGVWKVGDGVRVTIVNVYSSGSLKEKKAIWDEINAYRACQLNRIWCVVGDFNSIRTKEERKSLVVGSNYSREMREFNEFIEKAELMDIPMVGRKFTWYKPNGTAKSRIDRVLVSKEWMEEWLNSKQIVLSRSVSDHCVLVIKDSCPDWV